MKIKGIDVIYIDQVDNGTDDFGQHIYQEKEDVVSNVLVAPISSNEVMLQYGFETSKETYQLAVPKGDGHSWENVKVKFFGSTWKTVAKPLIGIEAMVPTTWHKKVVVEKYE